MVCRNSMKIIIYYKPKWINSDWWLMGYRLLATDQINLSNLGKTYKVICAKLFPNRPSSFWQEDFYFPYIYIGKTDSAPGGHVFE